MLFKPPHHRLNVEKFMREKTYVSITYAFNVKSCNKRNYYCRNIYIVKRGRGWRYFQIVKKPEDDQWLSTTRCVICRKLLLCYKEEPVMFIESLWDRRHGMENMYYYDDGWYIRKLELTTGLALASWYKVKIFLSTTTERYVFYTKKLTYIL